jgi:predicted CoA-binding protein
MMFTKDMVDDFLSLPTLAVVGVSRYRNKFGNAIFNDLVDKGYTVYIVHPSGEVIEGVQSYPRLADLPEQVGGVVLVIPSDEGLKVVKEAHALGIQRIWLQPGAESAELLEWGEQNGMRIVHDTCIMTVEKS